MVLRLIVSRIPHNERPNCTMYNDGNVASFVVWQSSQLSLNPFDVLYKCNRQHQWHNFFVCHRHIEIDQKVPKACQCLDTL
eukprot:14771021-Ditylum_brightwellii.AAC.1